MAKNPNIDNFYKTMNDSHFCYVSKKCQVIISSDKKTFCIEIIKDYKQMKSTFGLKKISKKTFESAIEKLKIPFTKCVQQFNEAIGH